MSPNCPKCGHSPTGKYWSQFGWIYTCTCKQGSFFGDERDYKQEFVPEKKRAVRKKKKDLNPKLTTARQ